MAPQEGLEPPTYPDGENPSGPLCRFSEESKLAFSLYGGPVFTRIYSGDIFMGEDWDAWGETGYQAGLKTYYSLNPGISVYAGVGLSNYRSVYEILDFDNSRDSVIKDEQYKEIDMDGEEYFASSIADGGTVLWLIERMKLQLLREVE